MCKGNWWYIFELITKEKKPLKTPNLWICLCLFVCFWSTATKKCIFLHFHFKRILIFKLFQIHGNFQNKIKGPFLSSNDTMRIFQNILVGNYIRKLIFNIKFWLVLSCVTQLSILHYGIFINKSVCQSCLYNFIIFKFWFRENF